MDAEGALRRKLQKMGPSRAIDNLLSKFGNLGTRLTYLYDLSLYLDWLKERGVGMTPDEFVKDNLECVYNSPATELRRLYPLLYRLPVVDQEFESALRFAMGAALGLERGDQQLYVKRIEAIVEPGD